MNESNKHLTYKKGETLNIFKEINLADILRGEEIESFLKESHANGNTTYRDDFDEDETTPRKNSGRAKGSNYQFERVSLILRFINLSIKKLATYEETVLVKGLEWYLLYLNHTG